MRSFFAVYLSLVELTGSFSTVIFSLNLYSSWHYDTHKTLKAWALVLVLNYITHFQRPWISRVSIPMTIAANSHYSSRNVTINNIAYIKSKETRYVYNIPSETITQQIVFYLTYWNKNSAIHYICNKLYI